MAFELKIGAFKPEHIGKMNFYLEALDREHKKNNENPSVGVILCASKEDEVVEFALSRRLSPTLISEYTLKLIDKKLLKLNMYVLLCQEIDCQATIKQMIMAKSTIYFTLPADLLKVGLLSFIVKDFL